MTHPQLAWPIDSPMLTGPRLVLRRIAGLGHLRVLYQGRRDLGRFVLPPEKWQALGPPATQLVSTACVLVEENSSILQGSGS